MLRPSLLALTLALSACTTTHTIQRTDADVLGGLNGALAGKHVTIVMVTERAEGKLLHVAPDSTRWLEGSTLRATPTSEVRSVVYDTRGRDALRGAAFGAGFGGLALLAAYADESESWEAELNRLLAPFMAVGSVTLFAAYGYVLSSPVTYRLVHEPGGAEAVEE